MPPPLQAGPSVGAFPSRSRRAASSPLQRGAWWVQRTRGFGGWDLGRTGVVQVEIAAVQPGIGLVMDS